MIHDKDIIISLRESNDKFDEAVNKHFTQLTSLLCGDGAGEDMYC